MLVILIELINLFFKFTKIGKYAKWASHPRDNLLDPKNIPNRPRSGHKNTNSNIHHDYNKREILIIRNPEMANYVT